MARKPVKKIQRRIYSGELGGALLFATLLLIVQKGLSGILRIQAAKRERTLFFSNGEILYARCPDGDDRLGFLLQRQGRLTDRQLLRAEKRMRLRRFFHLGTPRFGEILLSQGAIDEEELRQLLSYQVRERVLASFADTTGSFQFVEQDVDRTALDGGALELPTLDLIYQGIRAGVSAAVLKEFYFHVRDLRPQHVARKWDKTPLFLPTQDAFLMSRLEFSPSVEEVVKSSPLGEEPTLRGLFAMFCFDLLQLPGDLKPRLLKFEELEDSVGILDSQEPATGRLVALRPTLESLPLSCEPFSFAANTFRLLWTQVRALNRADGMKVFLVTSSCSQEGKTFVAANLAMAAAENPDFRVLLVDGDLRRPNIHRLFRLPLSPGLADRLTDPNRGKGNLPKISRFGSLHILTAGALVSNPPEIIGSESMRELVQWCRDHYDIVIFDTPPFLPVVDAKIMAELIDGVLVVVREGVSRRDHVKETLGIFDQEQLAGIIYNDSSAMQRQYGDNHYYVR